MTPPKLSCPQSYVIELTERQESYTVNFNDTRRRVNASDASGPVKVTFVPDRVVVPIGGFENVTVIATDSSGNRAACHFQVSVQATRCVDWELKPPANGAINCLPGDDGIQCIAACKPGFRFTDGDPVKTFTCDKKTHWSPTSVVPDCVSESKCHSTKLDSILHLTDRINSLADTQQADYHVVASVTYRANGAVTRSCLPQYQDLMAQHYMNLNTVLTQRCSAVNVNMNVTFIKSVPALIEENVVKVR